MMGSHRIAKVMTSGLVIVLVMLPAIAAAAPGNAVVVASRTQRVSGVDIAGEIVKSLDRIALGSAGATVTLDVEGAPHDIGVDLSDAGSALGRGGSGLVGLAIISAVAAAILRAAGVCVRLLH
jgi:hypothetical protein